jgi:hypothetical protein
VTVNCPLCKNGELYTLERVQGMAMLESITAEGYLEYEGTTEILWNTQVTDLVADNGDPLVFCTNWGCDANEDRKGHTGSQLLALVEKRALAREIREEEMGM